jgi:methylated-DNA-protein-cysteine methyltransferase-like protein
MANSLNFKDSILQIVKSIPTGKVMYYGQLADMVGTEARLVGFIMSGLTPKEMDEVPWYRVVAKDGYISSLKLGVKGQLHKALLEKENYKITEDKVNMNEHLWLFAAIDRLEDQVEQQSVFVEYLKR